jgi:protein-tyrosine phosphatase
MSVSVAISVPDFEQVVNFRDFGGHPAADGRRVVRGRLFRAGHLGEASERDVAALATLELAVVADLRRAAERKRLPSRCPRTPDAILIEHQAPLADVVAPHLAYLARPDLNEEEVSELLASVYRKYPFDPDYVAAFRQWFEALAVAQGPVLVNCHAGKDRTGMLAALTLYALGVSHEDIMADYMATNRHSRLDERMPRLAADFLRDNGRPVVEPLMRRLMGVETRYLEGCFAAIIEQHGTVDAYLAAVLGVDTEVRRTLRERYLED